MSRSGSWSPPTGISSRTHGERLRDSAVRAGVDDTEMARIVIDQALQVDADDDEGPRGLSSQPST